MASAATAIFCPSFESRSRHSFSPKTAELVEAAETAGADEHGGFAKAIEELGEPEFAGNVSAETEAAAEFAEPEKLAETIEELSEPEEAEALEPAEEAVAEAETSVETESAEVTEPLEVLEEVAEPEAAVSENHPHGLLAAAMRYKS